MVLLLDGRYHKTPYPTWPFRLRSFARNSDFLGEEQWTWLRGTPLPTLIAVTNRHSLLILNPEPSILTLPKGV
jgi:hypothetical protein